MDVSGSFEQIDTRRGCENSQCVLAKSGVIPRQVESAKASSRAMSHDYEMVCEHSQSRIMCSAVQGKVMAVGSVESLSFGRSMLNLGVGCVRCV